MTSTPAHVELVYNDNEVKLIEIGARIGGYRPRMYSISYGIDMVTQEIKLAMGQMPNLSWQFNAYCAVFELFPTREGVFKQIEGLTDNLELTYYSVKAKPGQTVGPAKNGYKAVAVVIVSSPDRQRFDQICARVNELKV